MCFAGGIAEGWRRHTHLADDKAAAGVGHDARAYLPAAVWFFGSEPLSQRAE